MILKGEHSAFGSLFQSSMGPDMEIIDDDAEKTGIQFVKINDKRMGKGFGIKKFPALTMIRDRQVFVYEGDLKVIFQRLS